NPTLPGNIDDRCYRRSLASALLRGALASGFVTAELHHSAGHDPFGLQFRLAWQSVHDFFSNLLKPPSHRYEQASPYTTISFVTASLRFFLSRQLLESSRSYFEQVDFEHCIAAS
ncbi:hypothetical protein RFN29_34215, partial [Mesorhizobium sp. VK22B]|nr:hypothetical protein [Mesorhizobium sp. VK22B]